MRVLLVISDLDFGGAQKQVVELARQLSAVGHEVAIHTLNREVPRARELEGSGVALVADQKRWKLDPGVLARLRARIGTWRPDVVHGFLYDGDIYARLAAIGSGAAVVNSERSDDYRLAWHQRLAHLATRPLVDAVVANSHSGAAFACRYYGYDAARMHVVWNGLRVEELERSARTDADLRAEFFGPGEHRIACLVGAIKPAKDYHLALEAAAALVRTDPRWRVLFVGDALAPAGAYRPGEDSDTAGYKDEVMRHHARLALGGLVRFAGARRDAPAIVAQSDVLFTTSCREGFPNCVLEAMALGVPVVATDFSDIRRILPRPAQVVPRRSGEAVARAIVAVDAEGEEIAAEQKRWVKAHASIERAAQELEHVYLQYVRPATLAQPT